MCSGGFRSLSVSLFSAAASALFFLLILTLTFAATAAAAVVACSFALQLITDAALCCLMLMRGVVGFLLSACDCV